MADFAALKKQLRRDVHAHLGVQAFYQDDSMDAPLEIRVRWHNKQQLTGDLEGEGWAQMIEGIDRLIFMAADARAMGIKRTGQIHIPDLDNEDQEARFELDAKEKTTGPIEEVWKVTRP